MLFALALRRGCSVRELLDRTDARELQEWVAYFDQGDPWLDLLAGQKDDLRTGLLGFYLVKLLGSGKRHFVPSDFAPKWAAAGDEPKRQSTAEMKRAAMKWAAATKAKQ